MDLRRARSGRALAVATAAAVAVLVAVPASQAQVGPASEEGPSTTATVPGSASTSTTAAPTTSTTTTTAPPSAGGPSGQQLSSGSNRAPAGAQDAGGDGAAAPSGGISVPPEAQRIIDSVRRSRPNSTDRLVAMLPELTALGISEAEAYRLAFGRFPIAGPARYSHDWLYPRYGPGFRFHLGTDIFAPAGTPVRAPVDGVAHSAVVDLGGLTVKVVMPDGTYFYLAHLAGLVEGFSEGMAVSTGDIVGYVGDSGNARGGAPHLHLGIYPHGGPPIDPKPILDGFVMEAIGRMPEVVEAVRASRPLPSVATDSRLALAEQRRALRPMLATEVLHPLASGGAAVPSELLYLLGANPFDGPRALVDLALSDLADGVDWSRR